MSILKEENFGTGLVADLHDGRDFSFGTYLESYESKIGEVALDWDKGYNIEDDLAFKFPGKKSANLLYLALVKATSSYKESVEYYLKRSTTPKSAKSIYSQIALPGGGAYLREGIKTACELWHKHGSRCS